MTGRMVSSLLLLAGQHAVCPAITPMSLAKNGVIVRFDPLARVQFLGSMCGLALPDLVGIEGYRLGTIAQASRERI